MVPAAPRPDRRGHGVVRLHKFAGHGAIVFQTAVEPECVVRAAFVLWYVHRRGLFRYLTIQKQVTVAIEAFAKGRWVTGSTSNRRSTRVRSPLNASSDRAAPRSSVLRTGYQPAIFGGKGGEVCGQQNSLNSYEPVDPD
jgi:hypothetical protein